MNHLFVPLVFLFLFVSSGVARAQDAALEIRAFMEERDRDIKEAVRSIDQNPVQREQARALINDRIDFEEMGRLALGKYYNDLTEDQRADFVETFGGIVRAQSLSDLSVYNAVVTFDSVGVTGSRAYVLTQARMENTRLKVEYLLHRKDSQWWLYDIIIDDVGTVEGYAISFQSYIRKRGFAQFMASLHKRLSSDSSTG